MRNTFYICKVSQLSNVVSSCHWQSLKRYRKILWNLFGTEKSIATQIICRFNETNVLFLTDLIHFTCTIFVLHPSRPLTFSSVWTCSDIVHLCVVIIFSLKMHSTSRFRSITCCSKLLFKFIILKQKKTLLTTNTRMEKTCSFVSRSFHEKITMVSVWAVCTKSLCPLLLFVAARL